MTLETTLFPAIAKWFIDASGGSIVFAALIGITGFSVIMNKLSIGLPAAFMISSFIMGVLYFESGAMIIGADSINVYQAFFAILIVGAAIFLVKKFRDG